jgi:hypothetical protein
MEIILGLIWMICGLIAWIWMVRIDRQIIVSDILVFPIFIVIGPIALLAILIAVSNKTVWRF